MRGRNRVVASPQRSMAADWRRRPGPHGREGLSSECAVGCGSRPAAASPRRRPAGRGGQLTNAWTASQPSWRRNCSSAWVSTPSATTRSPSWRVSPNTEPRTAVRCAVVRDALQHRPRQLHRVGGSSCRIASEVAPRP